MDQLDNSGKANVEFGCVPEYPGGVQEEGGADKFALQLACVFEEGLDERVVGREFPSEDGLDLCQFLLNRGIDFP